MSIFKEDTTAFIPHVLGEPEIRQKGQELAMALEQLEAIKAEKKQQARNSKDLEDTCIQDVARLREIVKTGVVTLEQPCQKVYEIDSRRVFWIYNGVKYHEREMRDDELGRATNETAMFGDSVIEDAF